MSFDGANLGQDETENYKRTSEVQQQNSSFKEIRVSIASSHIESTQPATREDTTLDLDPRQAEFPFENTFNPIRKPTLPVEANGRRPPPLQESEGPWDDIKIAENRISQQQPSEKPGSCFDEPMEKVWKVDSEAMSNHLKYRRNHPLITQFNQSGSECMLRKMRSNQSDAFMKQPSLGLSAVNDQPRFNTMPGYRMDYSQKSRSNVDPNSFFTKRKQHLSISQDQDENIRRKRTIDNQQLNFDAESFSTEFAHKLSISNRSMLEGSVTSR
ncbi:hypothetical protein FGO68_gene13614 [Halteria grandinella]|uniref:Uncharacterized protein n=1 Tax=Halteria grandinella TaxID=5974 RepID=A0A8J8T4F7_HALGN|nr:hypothetical protein FGO68_gene13614 [Halteria grandinella]